MQANSPKEDMLDFKDTFERTLVFKILPGVLLYL